MAHPSQLRQLAAFIEGRRGMTVLMARHHRHTMLQRFVQRRLPGFLAEHCLACAASDGQLIVFTDSAAWATQLRFALPGILGDVQKNIDPQLRRAQVRLLSDHRLVPARRQSTTPSSSVIREIQAAAASSPSPEISASLARLAATWRRLHG